MFNLADDLMLVMETTWPIIAITLVAVISLRITYLIKNKHKFILYEELLALLFIVYLLMFFQVVTYQDVISYGNNFIPFKELTRYTIGSKLFFKNVIGNILLFMPYGFFASYYLKLDKKRLAFLLVFIVSLSIECVQLVIGRCFDVDDVLLNIIGGMFGYFIYRLLDFVTDKMSKRTISTILIFALIALITILLYIMMWGIMKIGIFNETDIDLEKEIKILKKVLKKGLEIENIKKCEFNVIIVRNDYIHELNKKYRGKDSDTDVITFALEDDKTFNPEERVLGDIYISIDKVYSQALEYNHSIIREFAFLGVHGLLHLLGYDHMDKESEEIMFRLQDRILDEVGITK